MTFKCPKCGEIFPAPDESTEGRECPKCGYDPTSTLNPARFSEDESGFIVHQEVGYSSAPQPGSIETTAPNSAGKSAPQARSAIAERPLIIVENPRFLGVDKGGWICLGAGILIAIGVLAIPLFTQMLVMLPILVHEFGHAVFGWLFGYPSVPALDFQYGGGVTISFERHMAILVSVYALWIVPFVFWARYNLKRIMVLAILVIIYSICAFTCANDVIILYMGHGMELVFAGIFIYRALSGSSVVNSIERPLYGCVGMFIVMDDIRFAYRLMTDETTRQWYEAAKGGGHIMDFSRIAENYLNVELTSVAAFFLVCCILTPFLAWAFLRWKGNVYRLLT